VAIIDEGVFREVGELLASNIAKCGRSPCNKHGALLKGLVACTACGCAMGHHFATSKNASGSSKRYRYYVCGRAQKEGWSKCPGPSLPAEELESFVIGELRSLGEDNGLVRDAVLAAQATLRERLVSLEHDRDTLGVELDAARSDLRDIVSEGRDRSGSAAVAAELRERIRDLDARARRLDTRLAAMRDRVLDEDELVGALEAFDPLWEQLNAKERERLVHLLVKRVEWDAETETITVTFNAEAESVVDEEAVCPT